MKKKSGKPIIAGHVLQVKFSDTDYIENVPLVVGQTITIKITLIKVPTVEELLP